MGGCSQAILLHGMSDYSVILFETFGAAEDPGGCALVPLLRLDASASHRSGVSGESPGSLWRLRCSSSASGSSPSPVSPWPLGFVSAPPGWDDGTTGRGCALCFRLKLSACFYARSCCCNRSVWEAEFKPVLGEPLVSPSPHNLESR